MRPLDGSNVRKAPAGTLLLLLGLLAAGLPAPGGLAMAPLEAGSASFLGARDLPYPVLTVDGDDPHSRVLVPSDVEPRLDERLLDVRALSEQGLLAADGKVGVVVAGSSAVLPLLARDGRLEAPRLLDRLGLLLGRTTIADAVDLARHPGVTRIDLDGVARLDLAQSVPLIRADDVHARTDGGGAAVTGQGVVIAILDSGVDYTHPHLGGCFGPGCKVAAGYDYVNNDANPLDDHGHGTHVAATAAGSQGVAPGATIWAYKVCDASGACPESAVLSALNALVGSAAKVVSMSLGSPSECPFCSLSNAANALFNEGKVVVASAGNSGPGLRTIGTPASAEKVIAVGASDKSDQMAAFSSRGPVYNGNQVYAVKPEVAAPGVDIVAAVPTGSCALCHPTGQRSVSGTSMAAPHVAGTAALLRQEHPSWTATDVRAAILGRSVPIGTDARTEGTGRVDALDATTALLTIRPENGYQGIVPTGSVPFSLAKTLTVKNLGGATETVTFSGSSPSWGATFNPTSLSLGPGASGTVQLTAAGPADSVALGWNDGTATATASGSSSHARYNLLKNAVIHFNLPTEGRPMGLYDHDVNTMWSLPYDDVFDFPFRPGRFSVPGYIGCAFGANPCPLDFFFQENFTLETEAWVNVTTSTATHSITMSVQTKEGQTHNALSVGSCGSVRPTSSYCSTTRILQVVRHGLNYRATFGGTYQPLTVTSTAASDDWVLSVGQGLLKGTDAHFWSDATDGVAGPVAFTSTQGDLLAHTLEFALPDPWTQGLRWLSCNSRSFGSSDPRVMPVTHGLRENLWLDLLQKPVGTGSSVVLDGTPCSAVLSYVRAGSASDWFSCTDGSGCREVAQSHELRPVDGAVRQDRPSGADNPYDDTYGRRSGATVVVDGAPSFGTDPAVFGDKLYIRNFGSYDHWVPASGGAAFGWTFNAPPVAPTYKASVDGDTIQSGALGGFFSIPVGYSGAVRFRSDNPDTLLDRATCAATFELAYDNGSSDDLFPGFVWARVLGDGVFRSRFAGTEDLVLKFRVRNSADSGSVSSATVTLLRGLQTLATVPAVPEGGGVYSANLPELGAGAYRLRISASTTDGESALLAQDPGYIVGSGGCGLMPPVALASVSTRTADVGQSVTFNGASSYDPSGQSLTYAWSGSGVSGSGSSFSTSFGSGGRKCVTLTVTDTEGASDTDQVCVRIAGPIAVAQVTPARANPGQSVTFDGSGSYDPNGGTIVAHEWRRAGQTVSNAAVYATSFSASGPQCLELRVTNQDGKQGTANGCVAVNFAPTAAGTPTPASVRPGESVNFDGSASTDPDGSIASYEWKRGGVTVGNGPTYATSFAARGVECLDLVVTDNEALSGTTPVCVTVHTSPLAVATADPSAAGPGYPFSFDGTTSVAYEPGGLTYEWTLSGSTVSTDASFTMSFPTTGVRCLDLTVSDSVGQTGSDSVCVTVLPPFAVTVSPTKLTYRMTETPVLKVYAASGATPVAGGDVTISIRYESGVAALDALLANGGCATRWTLEGMTDATGRATFNVPRALGRCLGGSDVAEIPTNLENAKWKVDAFVEKGVLTGSGTTSYRVNGV